MPPDDAPCSYELRVTLTGGGIDEIGADSQAHLRGYLRALLNHELISEAEHAKQLDALRATEIARYLHRHNLQP